ncbi:MAG: hypothetical protein A3G93_07180 [Nitrospinae bacterium RIFCSPLOWO2_12_FULL_45_22]|nr:MAG: hypothetical protein A3G93_07180 [Nitrospinae bacterium RIFCSPLOWO2_12_FULL_45_22]
MSKRKVIGSMSEWLGGLKDLFRRNKEESALRPAKAFVEHRIPLEERSIEELITEWKGFYQDIFGIRADFSNLQIPEKESGFNRLIIMAGGMTPQRLYDKCGELFPCWKFAGVTLDNLVTYSERTSKNDAYAIWVRDYVEADEEFRSLSADKIKAKNITTETLEERLLHELKYFRETGEHLDMENITICTGSRYSGGGVPAVSWVSGKLRIRTVPSALPAGVFRSRRVVY